MGDTGFEPVTSTVGAQKEGIVIIMRGDLWKTLILFDIRFSIYFDIFAYISIFLTNFGHSLGTVNFIRISKLSDTRGLLDNKDIDKLLLHFKHTLSVFITIRRYCFGIFLKIWHAV